MTTDPTTQQAPIQIGWAQTDIVPPQLPVLISGQFPARLSEGVDDPLTATALVLEEAGEHVVFVSVDVVTIPDDLRDGVRARLGVLNLPGLDPQKVILHATHTHTGPEVRRIDPASGTTAAAGCGVDLGEIPVDDYLEFLYVRLADLVADAWRERKPGAISYGLDYAVVGRNRRWVNDEGVSRMYGLKPESAPRFRHIEGYEDHAVNLLAAYDPEGRLTGVIVNVACPSQETGGGFTLSADFWHEVRLELRRRLGGGLFILPQCSSAGDISPHRLMEKRANERMQRLRNRSNREEIALRIADAVDRILPVIATERITTPGLRHEVRTLAVPLNVLNEEQVAQARQAAGELGQIYETEKARLEADPSLREQPRWYVPLTAAFRKRSWHEGVVRRYQLQKECPTLPAEIHAVALGEVGFASHPFEYYVDYGMQIKLRSPATQTFLIQLAGGGTYVPSPRSVRGGGYGSLPASNPVGQEGGQLLAEETVRLLAMLFPGEEG